MDDDEKPVHIGSTTPNVLRRMMQENLELMKDIEALAGERDELRVECMRLFDEVMRMKARLGE